MPSNGGVRSFVHLEHHPALSTQTPGKSCETPKRIWARLPEPMASHKYCGAIPASDFSTVRLSENCTKFIVRNGLALELRIGGSFLLSSD